jgi:hypothetical protein
MAEHETTETFHRRGPNDGFHVGYHRWTTHADYVALTEALGYGNDRDEPAATPEEITDPLLEMQAAAHEHFECPVWCDECEQYETPRSCAHCSGSGYGGPLLQTMDNIQGWIDCEWCAGDGREHAPDGLSPLAALQKRIRALADEWQSNAAANEHAGHFPWAMWQHRSNELRALLDEPADHRVLATTEPTEESL